jgi:hypothetical protein
LVWLDPENPRRVVIDRVESPGANPAAAS